MQIYQIVMKWNNIDHTHRQTQSTNANKKKKIKNLNLQKLSKILTCSDSDIEPISSDDEIYLNRLIDPVLNDCPVEDQVKNYDVTQDVIQKNDDDNVELEIEISTADVTMNDDTGLKDVDHHIVVVNEVDNPPEQHQQRSRKRRSITKGLEHDPIEPIFSSFVEQLFFSLFVFLYFLLLLLLLVLSVEKQKVLYSKNFFLVGKGVTSCPLSMSGITLSWP